MTINMALNPSNLMVLFLMAFLVRYSLLHPLGFKMKKRGRIKVKGKGRMDTYFLLEAPPSGGKTNERLARPSRTGENDKLLSNVCRII